MYQFAICDDNSADLSYVRGLVEKWAKGTGNGVQVEEYGSAESFWFTWEENKNYDVLLLDIEMAGMSGMELAKKLRAKDRLVQIIFITGYMEYFSDGYDVEALHYLLKPVTEEKLLAVLDRAAERRKTGARALLLSLADETVRVPLYEIRYLEAQRNYVTIHASLNYTVKRTLRSLETELDEGFFRTGRSFIVNLRYVKKITRRDIILKDDTAVPLARGYYEAANQAMIGYF